MLTAQVFTTKKASCTVLGRVDQQELPVVGRECRNSAAVKLKMPCGKELVLRASMSAPSNAY